MNNAKMKISFDSLIGLTLEDIGHAADMIWVALSPSGKAADPAISIDFLCETNIFISGERLTGTNDIGGGSHSQYLFDQRIEKVRQSISCYRIEGAAADDRLSLTLRFSNGLLIQTADELLEPEDERWRIFIKGTELPHFVAMGDHIEV